MDKKKKKATVGQGLKAVMSGTKLSKVMKKDSDTKKKKDATSWTTTKIGPLTIKYKM